MQTQIAKCERRTSAIHGDGLFANAPYMAGETIVSIAGNVESAESLSDRFLANGAWIIMGGDKVILAKDAPEACLINHADKANAELDTRKWTVRATRAISPGEEIFLNYKSSHYSPRLRRLQAFL